MLVRKKKKKPEEKRSKKEVKINDVSAYLKRSTVVNLSSHGSRSTWGLLCKFHSFHRSHDRVDQGEMNCCVMSYQYTSNWTQ